jgi:hypothetical protein
MTEEIGDDVFVFSTVRSGNEGIGRRFRGKRPLESSSASRRDLDDDNVGINISR